MCRMRGEWRRGGRYGNSFQNGSRDSGGKGDPPLLITSIYRATQVHSRANDISISYRAYEDSIVINHRISNDLVFDNESLVYLNPFFVIFQYSRRIKISDQ